MRALRALPEAPVVHWNTRSSRNGISALAPGASAPQSVTRLEFPWAKVAMIEDRDCAAGLRVWVVPVRGMVRVAPPVFRHRRLLFQSPKLPSVRRSDPWSEEVLCVWMRKRPIPSTTNAERAATGMGGKSSATRPSPPSNTAASRTGSAWSIPRATPPGSFTGEEFKRPAETSPVVEPGLTGRGGVC